jgi:hypothetical protein
MARRKKRSCKHGRRADGKCRKKASRRRRGGKFPLAAGLAVAAAAGTGLYLATRKKS